MTISIPNYMHVKIVDEEKYPTAEFESYITQLAEEIGRNFSNEGLIVPTLSSDPDSVEPPLVGGQFRVLELSNKTQVGTLLYDSFVDELKIFKADNLFHVIPTL